MGMEWVGLGQGKYEGGQVKVQSSPYQTCPDAVPLSEVKQ